MWAARRPHAHGAPGSCTPVFERQTALADPLPDNIGTPNLERPLDGPQMFHGEHPGRRDGLQPFEDLHGRNARFGHEPAEHLELERIQHPRPSGRRSAAFVGAPVNGPLFAACSSHVAAQCVVRSGFGIGGACLYAAAVHATAEFGLGGSDLVE